MDTEQSEKEMKNRIEYLENYIDILNKSAKEAEEELTYLKKHVDIPQIIKDLIEAQKV